MPVTPAYFFTLLLGIWVLSVVGCIALGILCYRLLAERRCLQAQLEERAMPRPVSNSSASEWHTNTG
jgi:hypothetical protein